MRKLTTSVVGVVLIGLTLILVTGRKTAAAPGFSVEDFKGVYVGHFTGGSAPGIISFTSDGAGTVVLEVTTSTGLSGCSEYVLYSLSPSGVVMDEVGGLIDFRGYLSDRGKTLDFVFDIDICHGGISGAGTVTIQ